MSLNKINFRTVVLILMIVIAAVLRVLGAGKVISPLANFTPIGAMALFGGAVIRNKKLSFVLPLASMLLSDVLYEALYRSGLSEIPGFYSGQFTNYVLFAGITFIGFWMRNLSIGRIAAGSVIAPTVYFLLSNLFVWIGGAGYSRPHTFGGLMLCYEDGLPFLRTSLLYTIMFSAILFGGYFLLQRFIFHRRQLA